LSLVNYAALKQLLLVLSSDWSHFGDLLVHEWLSETWLIQFIVSHFPVTNEIDDDIMLEFLSIFSSSSENEINIIQAVSVDMENWSIYSLGQVRAVDGRSTLIWSCGETNLVVHNNMDCTSNSVILQILHLD
jgi:hypothetical protein